MAIKFSQEQLKLLTDRYYGKYYSFDNLTIIKIIINKILIYYFYFKVLLINLKRKIFALAISTTNALPFLYIKKNSKLNHLNENIKFNVNIDEINLAKYSSDLKNNNFVFIENFLNKDCYEHLLNNWPNINFFSLSKKIIKHYSTGFLSIKGKKNANFGNHKVLEETIMYIKSFKFQKFFNELIKFETKKKYFNYSTACSMVGNNSFLIPHIDGVQNNHKNTYNLIYFVDGNNANPSQSGGTGLYSDNNFVNPLFIPTTLKNSCLIYNSTSEFYHGFNFTKLPNNVYGKKIIFQFLPE
jgi:hypothetical protein